MNRKKLLLVILLVGVFTTVVVARQIIISTNLCGKDEIVLVSGTTIIHQANDICTNIILSPQSITLGDVVKAVGKDKYRKDDYYYGEVLKIDQKYITITYHELSIQVLKRSDWGFTIYREVNK